jgi:hypothetical protein
MSGAEIDDAAAAKQASYAPRHFPGLVQFLARQTPRMTYGTCQPMKQSLVGKPIEISIGQASAGRV